MIRVESIGSWWLLDDDLSRYQRLPKEEKPRENGWGGPEAGVLQDAVWHDMDSWFLAGQRLHIATTVRGPNHEVLMVSAPLSVDQYEAAIAAKATAA